MTKIVANKKIQVGMYWNSDGHDLTVTEIEGNRCKITESWIAEDIFEPVEKFEEYEIVEIDGVEYAQSIEYPPYKLCSTAAFNYPY